MHHPVGVLRLYARRRVRRRSRRAADEQGNLKPAPRHLARRRDHLIQRRRDKPAQADDVGVHVARGVQYGLGRNHDAQIDHFVVVATQNDPDDVFADVVDVALDGGDYYFAVGARGAFAGGALRLYVRSERGDRFLHHAGAFDDLRQKHLPRPEQVADLAHAVHERPFNDVQRAVGRQPRFFGIRFDVGVHAVDQRALEALGYGQGAPFAVIRPPLFRARPRRIRELD